MFDFLNYLGNKVVGRYKTVESNIRNRSNSFYDAFLDLLEDTVKAILMNEDVGYDGRTCGEVLREPDVNNFFKHKVGIDKEIYAKVGDYIKKINEHKHHNEKYVNVDTVVNYMNVFYEFVTPYMRLKGVDVSPFNKTFFEGIYGITIERSKELDNVSQKVDEFVSSTNARMDEHDIKIAQLEALSIEFRRRQMQPQQPVKQSAQNNAINRPMTEEEAWQWFLKTSKKSWRWLGNLKEFDKSRHLSTFSQILLIVIGFLATIFTSISGKLYTTFTFFENIWLVFAVIMIVHASKAQLKYNSHDLARNNSCKYKQDQYGVWNPGKEKTVFKVFRILGIISVICNIIFIWMKVSNISLLAMILEILFLGAIIFSSIMNLNLFSGYSLIYLEGKNVPGTEYIVLVWDPVVKEFFTEEEYKKRVPFLFT